MACRTLDTLDIGQCRWLGSTYIGGPASQGFAGRSLSSIVRGCVPNGTTIKNTCTSSSCLPWNTGGSVTANHATRYQLSIALSFLS
jgi:hypothetical protein